MDELIKFVARLVELQKEMKSNIMTSSCKDDWQCLRITLQHIEDAIYNIERNILKKDPTKDNRRH